MILKNKLKKAPDQRKNQVDLNPPSGAILGSFLKISVLGFLIFKLLDISDFSFKFSIPNFQDFYFSRICDSKF
jgi:hypothetical protein